LWFIGHMALSSQRWSWKVSSWSWVQGHCMGWLNSCFHYLKKDIFFSGMPFSFTRCSLTIALLANGACSPVSVKANSCDPVPVGTTRNMTARASRAILLTEKLSDPLLGSRVTMSCTNVICGFLRVSPWAYWNSCTSTVDASRPLQLMVTSDWSAEM